ncbi:hypothetical protein HHK36_001991 [Tetracentron sinense]|uniref:Uncharacterized protein n=1 Tax=Tetracentron sinense TaxID=13715 RepID=A0A834ZZ14_TETSI|nr:hypothetical protein HHK36_001991 [Tetracentron sinense]
MSILQYPDAINAPEIQIWNNAAFDNGDADKSADIKASWCPLQPVFVNRPETFESDSSKENQSPTFRKSPVSVKSPIPIKPLNLNAPIEISQGKPLKLLSKQALLPTPTFSKDGIEGDRDERKIDIEIQEIELEISRLSSKLEALRLEKAERNLKTIEMRGRIVPAKFMEPKQSFKSSSVSSNTEFRRRGVSLGPSEIVAGIKSRQKDKPEITPIQSIQSRRKSCFWKLQGIIEEEKVTKERGRSMSVSPKSRLSVSKIQASKKGLTTGSKKPAKRDDGVMSCIQPKKLFKEGEKTVPSKHPSRNGRVVASRYNQVPVHSFVNQIQTDPQKRQFPEIDNGDSKSCDKKRASSVGKSRWFLQESGRNQVMGNRVKKRWEIPIEIETMDQKILRDSSPPLVLKIADLLPKIRTARCTNDSPRDSGPAKKVAELIGRKSYFGAKESEVETSVSQALSFEDEEDQDK